MSKQTDPYRWERYKENLGVGIVVFIFLLPGIVVGYLLFLLLEILQKAVR